MSATLAAREAAARLVLALEACAGRDVVLLEGAPEGAAEALREVATSLEVRAPAAVPDTPRLVVGLTPPAQDGVRRLVGLAAAWRAAGHDLLLVLPGRVVPLVRRRLPDAALVLQRAVEVAWTAPEGTGGGDVALPTEAGPGTVRWAIVLCGPDVPASGTAAPAAAPVHAEHTEALARRADVLATANARLRATSRPLESAAAGSVLGKAAGLQRRLDELQERLEAEVEVAKQNDRLFQEARAVIAEREREIAGLRGTLAKPSHRVAASAAHRSKRLPGAKAAGRLVFRVLTRRG